MIDTSHIDLPAGDRGNAKPVIPSIRNAIQGAAEAVLDRRACDRGNEARRAIRGGVAQTRVHPNALGRGGSQGADGFDDITFV